MELTESTLANLLAGIDRILSGGFGYRMRVGATGQGTRLLRDDPEKPLPLAEMIRITNSRHVRVWWSLNPPSEPIDLLFCAGRSTNTEDSTLLLVTSGLTHAITGAPLPMRSGPVAIRSRTLTATSQTRPLRPQSEPPHRGPPGPVIPQKTLGEHTASIGRTLANESQSPMSLLIGAWIWQTGRSRPRIPALHRLLVSKLPSLVLTWALVF